MTQRVRQVVILTAGAVWQSDYERYAHKAVARNAGLSEDAVIALAKGEEAPDLADEEVLAQRFTRQLMLHHHVDRSLFDQAKATFGVRGIVDLLFLAGCYQTVCSLLNAFEIPAPKGSSPKPISSRSRHFSERNPESNSAGCAYWRSLHVPQ